jgi:hypothetical protein
MRWPNMPLCGLHDHVICAKHYLFGQAKPGLPEFADAMWLKLHHNFNHSLSSNTARLVQPQ